MLYYNQDIANREPERGEIMNDNKRITNNLKRMREERGFKQKYIAEQLGITQNYYSQIENGHRPPQVEHLLKLREIFGVSLDEIFLKIKSHNAI